VLNLEDSFEEDPTPKFRLAPTPQGVAKVSYIRARMPPAAGIMRCKYNFIG
jgi:hypothetical protein